MATYIYRGYADNLTVGEQTVHPGEPIELDDATHQQLTNRQHQFDPVAEPEPKPGKPAKTEPADEPAPAASTS